jgi:hypothetical protein
LVISKRSEDVVSYEHMTGTPASVAGSLRRRVSAYTRQDRVRAFKIGITTNPERRFVESYTGEYEKMVVVYRTMSRRHVCDVERDLVEHNWALCNNLVGGGGGRASTGPFYLYIVRS